MLNVKWIFKLCLFSSLECIHSFYGNFENTIFTGWRYKKGVVSSLITKLLSFHSISSTAMLVSLQMNIQIHILPKKLKYCWGSMKNWFFVDLKFLDILFLLCLLFLFPSPSGKQFRIGLQNTKSLSIENWIYPKCVFWKNNHLFILKVQMFSYFDFIEFDFD